MVTSPTLNPVQISDLAIVTPKNTTEFGDCRAIMRRWAEIGVRVQTCVTSPPYFGLRDYGVDGQIGSEKTPQEYVDTLVETFRAVRDVLADDGTLWLNLGDSYAGSWGNQGRKEHRGKQRPIRAEMVQQVLDGRYPTKGTKTGSLKNTPGLKNKDLIGIPWRVAFALQADGWWLRQEIIWSKPNPMPRPDRDRCVTSHEHIFLLSKRQKYHFDYRAIQEPVAVSTISRLAQKNLPNQIGSARAVGKTNGNLKAVGNGVLRNRRSVWNVVKQGFKGAHFATFPPDLIKPCILAGSRPGDIVLDPFMGSGTTAGVALKHGRAYLGCELNPAYGDLHAERIRKIVEKD